VKSLYRHIAFVAVSVLLTLASGAWLAIESARLVAEQNTDQALSVALSDLHTLHDAQIDIESAYRATLMTGSGKALNVLRDGVQRWQTSFSQARNSLRASSTSEGEIDALGTQMRRHFFSLETQLERFRGGGGLADIDAEASHANPASPYRQLEARILTQRSALVASMAANGARIRSLSIGLLLSTLAAAVAVASCLMTARRQLAAMQETLSREVVHDALTGLANRRYLHAWLQAQISFAARMGDSFHVLYLDLDGFERINDEYGRPTGDQILIAAAQRLKTTTRGGDFVARQQEDEFVIVFSCDPDSREIGRYAARLIRSLGKSLVDGVPGGILSASIGVASYPADGATADDLVTAARRAMLQAKQAGKACYAYRREAKPDNQANIWEVSRF
jgi:diguanylate cyclase (GGDEF)-like protein